MPARKSSALNNRHDTKADRSARESAEAAVVPKTQITVTPPVALKGHPHAAAVWKRTVGLYAETEGTIITAFDQDLLTKYCLAEEELTELFALRRDVKKAWDTHNKWLSKLKPKGENLKDYFNALTQANALLARFQGLDARQDGKRKLLFVIAQSLYLTPRSRAGAAPTEKPPEPELDEMDKLLDGDTPVKAKGSNNGAKAL